MQNTFGFCFYNMYIRFLRDSYLYRRKVAFFVVSASPCFTWPMCAELRTHAHKIQAFKKAKELTLSPSICSAAAKTQVSVAWDSNLDEWEAGLHTEGPSAPRLNFWCWMGNVSQVRFQNLLPWLFFFLFHSRFCSNRNCRAFSTKSHAWGKLQSDNLHLVYYGAKSCTFSKVQKREHILSRLSRVPPAVIAFAGRELHYAKGG